MMASRQNGERIRVMVVERDLDFGLKLADWLATDGYQPVFVRNVEAAIDELSGVRPREIFVGLGGSEPAMPFEMAVLIMLIQTVCMRLPMIMISVENSEDGNQ